MIILRFVYFERKGFWKVRWLILQISFANLCDIPYNPNILAVLLKVSKSWKQFMVSSIFSKNKRWDNFMYWELSKHSFYGRIEDSINCFWDLLTFNQWLLYRRATITFFIFIWVLQTKTCYCFQVYGNDITSYQV